jgi:diamine N-acetyltransferase
VPIGTIDLSEFSPSHKRAEIGIAINSQYRNMGYASQAIKLLEDYAFKFLHMHSLTALVSVQNDISSRLFISCGYQQTGTLKDWICTEHGYEDVVVFQKLNKE